MDLEPLTTVAEVAVAMAGFASIVIVFGDRQKRGIPLIYRISTRGMLLCSLAVVFASFIPFLVSKLAPDTAIWMWSCRVLIVLCVLLLVAANRDGNKVKQVVRPVYRYIGGAPLLVALGFALAGSVGVTSAFTYLGALVSLLFLSAFQFFNIVMMYISPVEE